MTNQHDRPAESLALALRTLHEIANDPAAPPRVRTKAMRAWAVITYGGTAPEQPAPDPRSTPEDPTR